MLYILVAGSRGFDDYETMRCVMNRIICSEKEITIVSGGARGADRLAEKYAKENGFNLKVFPAQWNKYGKSAGYRRNEEMQKFIANQTRRRIICFWDGQSKGTAHNFSVAKKYNNTLTVYNYKEKTFVKP